MSDQRREELKDWLKGYVKHRDVFLKSIQLIDDNEDGFTVKFKDRETIYIIIPTLTDLNAIIEKSEEQLQTVIAVLNIKKNLDFLILNWHKLDSDPNLTFFFINPDSKKDLCWIIRPYQHSKIADEDSLKTGLLALFESVDACKGT